MNLPVADISEFKKQFDPLLAGEFDRHLSRASAFSADPDCAALLAHVKDIALAGGKRIRPYVAYLMYRSAGGEDESVLESLVAFEIFHTFALVHDDIIDHGSLRHGVPSLHEFARTLSANGHGRTGAIAESLALLAGDLVFSWSRETFARTVSAPQTHALFNDMVYAVVLGQMLDVKIMDHSNPSEAMILEKTSLKTAEYTFVYPMMIGASLAGNHDALRAWCTTIGNALGIAFQVQDDLLDLLGDERKTGKRPFKDLAEGQHTIFTAYVRSHGSPEDLKELDAVFGKSVSAESTQTMRDLFERTGAVAYGREMIAAKIAEARTALAEASLDATVRAAWEQLIERMEQRIA